MKHVDREAVAEYVLRCYVGAEPRQIRGKTRQMRVFQWRENRKRYEGNSRAFYLHLTRKFRFRAKPRGHEMLSRILIAEGYRARAEHTRDKGTVGVPFNPQRPWRKIIK